MDAPGATRGGVARGGRGRGRGGGVATSEARPAELPTQHVDVVSTEQAAEPAPPLAEAQRLLDAMTQVVQTELAGIRAERAQLAKDIAGFEDMRAKIATVHFPNKVKLNIGGMIFVTSIDTLRKEKDSMLAAMFSGKGFKVEPDDEGAYFIDRDGTQFRHILNFLRSGKVMVPDDGNDLAELLEELDFYQVASYSKAIKEAMGREFKFASQGDQNGVLYWLGTDRGKKAWSNPIASGQVKVSCSGNGWAGQSSALADRAQGTCGVCNMNPFPWFRLDLPVPVQLTDYTASRGGCHNPSNWKVEGSLDGSLWEPVSLHAQDAGLNTSVSARWSIRNEKYFKSFRWSCTGGDWGGPSCNCLHMSGIELYGRVRLHPEP